ncbi:MAG TPA: PQQ-binding-like beta-propeller repeat protein [Gaiellaceae bacterium]
MKTLFLVLALVVAAPAAASDWPEFGYTSSRQNVGPASTGITAANVGKLHRRQIQLDGTVDSSPIYLHGAKVVGKTHDALFVTTTYGRTEAIDVHSGKMLWRYTPPSYSQVAGSARITTMSPVADPSRTAIYAGAPDGFVRKLSVANGHVLWQTSLTRDPTHEKLAAALNFSNGLVIAATDGYIGDAPPYQGHVVTVSASNGHIVGVWNSLCSNRHTIIQPSTCPGSDSAIWGRSAPVVVPGTGDLLVATGNGPFDGRDNWGDSVLLLSPNGKTLLKHWTPTNQSELNSDDLDLGSTAPALLDDGYFVQGGKDGKLRLLSLSHLAGVNAKTGGEVQTVDVPGATDLFSEPAIWQGKWVFLGTSSGTAAWRLSGGRLHEVWSNGNGGSSPVVAGGLLYVEWSGGIHVYNPSSGHQLAVLPLGNMHWQSPVVADGFVAAAEGNSNDHATSGILDIYS